MRTGLLFLTLSLALGAPGTSRAGFVYHGTEGVPGIVADSPWWSLDSFGHVWLVGPDLQWERVQELDVPIPVSQIRFWAGTRLVTIDGEILWYLEHEHVWRSAGTWPVGTADAGQSPRASTPSAESWPNPTAEQCHVRFSMASQGPVALDVADVTGRRVRTLVTGLYPAGDFTLTWDGRDDAGRSVESGVYFLRVVAGDDRTTKRVVIAR